MAGYYHSFAMSCEKMVDGASASSKTSRTLLNSCFFFSFKRQCTIFGEERITQQPKFVMTKYLLFPPTLRFFLHLGPANCLFFFRKQFLSCKAFSQLLFFFCFCWIVLLFIWGLILLVVTSVCLHHDFLFSSLYLCAVFQAENNLLITERVTHSNVLLQKKKKSKLNPVRSS